MEMEGQFINNGLQGVALDFCVSVIYFHRKVLHNGNNFIAACYRTDGKMQKSGKYMIQL